MNKYYSNKQSIDFYKNNRNKVKHLYRSEKKFFIKAAKKSNSFLDLGCALGGFINIINEIKKKKFNYLGLDNQYKLIKIAKKNNPKYNFLLITKNNFPLKKKFDLVFSLGTLHHIKKWKTYILQMKKLSNRYLLFDVRLTKDLTTNSLKQFQKITFGKKWDRCSKINYVTINYLEFETFLNKNFKHFKIEKIKYLNKVGKGYVGKYKKVIMATFLLEKNS